MPVLSLCCLQMMYLFIRLEDGGCPSPSPKKRQISRSIFLRPGKRILDLERLTRLKTQMRKIKVFGVHSVFVCGGRDGGESPSYSRFFETYQLTQFRANSSHHRITYAYICQICVFAGRIRGSCLFGYKTGFPSKETRQDSRSAC